MKKSILTVTLNPALDKFFVIRKSRRGQKDVILNPVESAGGKGINISRALHGLGLPTVASGLLGGSMGKKIKRLLDQEEIPNDFLFPPAESRTNVTIFDTRKNQHTRILESGHPVPISYYFQLKKKLQSCLDRTEWVVLSGRNATGFPTHVYRELIRVASSKKIRTIVDTRGKALKESLKASPFMLKPNLQEAEELLGRKLDSLDKIKSGIRRLHSFGITLVIISMGEKGAVGSDGNYMWKASRPEKLTIINEVGCGDSLIAGFLYGWSQRLPFYKCLQLGVACGSLNTQTTLPGSIKKKLLYQEIPRIILEKI